LSAAIEIQKIEPLTRFRFALALYVSAVLLGRSSPSPKRCHGGADLPTCGRGNFGLGVIGAVPSSVRGQPPRFLTVAPGIEHASFKMQPKDAEPFSGHAFKVDLDMAQLRLVPAGGPSSRRTVEEIVAPYTAVVAINASFFDNEGRAMGLGS
jgi:hypothetical protein